MAFTNFYVQSTGSNLNSGSTKTDSATFTYASGNWVAATGVFTVASGNPSSDGVAVGDFASVYANGDTATGFVGRVTARDTTTITVSLTAKSGTAPVDGTGNRTLKIGGAWAGMSGSVAFPFGFVQSTMVNASSDPNKVWIKGGTTYNITAAMTHANVGPTWFEGYTTTEGDEGCFTVDGGTSGASYILLTYSANVLGLANFIFSNNGATGSADGISVTGNSCSFRNGTVFNMRRCGLRATGNIKVCEIEAYNCNTSNSNGFGNLQFATAGSSIERVVSHSSQSGANCVGIVLDTSLNLIDCIVFGVQGYGIMSNGDTNQSFYNLTIRDTGNHSFYFSGGSQVMSSSFTNCAFFKSGGYGISFRTGGALGHIGNMLNCVFGSGTEGHTSGNYNTGVGQAMMAIGETTFTSNANPWASPSTGDFSISSSLLKGTGRGKYRITKSGLTQPTSYRDISAVQHQDSGSSSGAGLMAVF